jgi:hypothetical protein
MKYRPINLLLSPAKLKADIARQQEVAAGFYRAGKKKQARMARNKLIVMLNMLEMLSFCHEAERKSA